MQPFKQRVEWETAGQVKIWRLTNYNGDDPTPEPVMWLWQLVKNNEDILEREDVFKDQRGNTQQGLVDAVSDFVVEECVALRKENRDLIFMKTFGPEGDWRTRPKDLHGQFYSLKNEDGTWKETALPQNVVDCDKQGQDAWRDSVVEHFTKYPNYGDKTIKVNIGFIGSTTETFEGILQNNFSTISHKDDGDYGKGIYTTLDPWHAARVYGKDMWLKDEVVEFLEETNKYQVQCDGLSGNIETSADELYFQCRICGKKAGFGGAEDDHRGSLQNSQTL
jgi:hypothetical protein